MENNEAGEAEQVERAYQQEMKKAYHALLRASTDESEHAHIHETYHILRNPASRAKHAQLGDCDMDPILTPDDIRALQVSDFTGTLWLGSQKAICPPVLFAQGIRLVLTIGCEMKYVGPILRSFEALSQNDKFTHLQFDIVDSLEDERLITILPEAVHAIKTALAQNSVLVHCARGVSRSAAVVCAFLMSCGLCHAHAMQHIRAKRPFVCPNETFQKQLLKFHEEYAKVPCRFCVAIS
jgi:hypothetical protein